MDRVDAGHEPAEKAIGLARTLARRLDTLDAEDPTSPSKILGQTLATAQRPQ